MTKHLAIKDEIYEELSKMKPDEDRSFSFVLRQLIDQNKTQKEEIQRMESIIERLTSKDKRLTQDYLKSRRESDIIDM